ncbi:hypothetical protein EON65_10580 [archaeon]|nr:MAG: hypothetical protein EON65_10580 [archaeon]
MLNYCAQNSGVTSALLSCSREKDVVQVLTKLPNMWLSWAETVKSTFVPHVPMSPVGERKGTGDEVDMLLSAATPEKKPYEIKDEKVLQKSKG